MESAIMESDLSEWALTVFAEQESALRESVWKKGIDPNIDSPNSQLQDRNQPYLNLLDFEFLDTGFSPNRNLTPHILTSYTDPNRLSVTLYGAL